MADAQASEACPSNRVEVRLLSSAQILIFGKTSGYYILVKYILPTEWTPEFAYAVGLIVTDGCLSKDGRHIDLTSKDLDQIQTFIKILGLKNKIGLKSSSTSNRKYYRVQFGNVKFYRFLLSIGLTPRKSKTIGEIKVPDKYFRDFLRGSLDGDGWTYSYWDPRWKKSFQLYTGFTSASKNHLIWLNSSIEQLFGVRGTIRFQSRAYTLEYAKKNSIILLRKLYYKKDLLCLERKHSKIIYALGIIAELSRDGETGKPITLRW